MIYIDDSVILVFSYVVTFFFGMIVCHLISKQAHEDENNQEVITKINGTEVSARERRNNKILGRRDDLFS